MSTAIDPYQLWGERTSLLPKKLAYVFSLDLRFRIEPSKAYWIGNELACRLEIEPASESDPHHTYHVLDSNLVELPNGSIHDVPSIRATSGGDWLRLRKNSTAELDARVILDAEQPRGTMPADPRRMVKRMALRYGGVANLTRPHLLFTDGEPTAVGREGATQNGEEKLGTAFVALRFDSSHPLYRWLVITQYVGFGEVHIATDFHEEAKRRYRRLRFSYDVYSAG